MTKWLNDRFLFVVLAFVALSCKKPHNNPDPNPTPQPQTTFTNPLLNSGPDPWVIKKDSFYYYTNTLGIKIALRRTKKMSELGLASQQTIWTPPASGNNAYNIWAPELHYLNGKWYVYYAAGSSAADNSTQRLYVLENSSQDPLSGTWVDKGQIGDPSANFFAIDGTILQYSGNNYLIWSGHASASDQTQRIYIARMSDPWTLATPRTLIASPQYAWESIGAPPAVNEGPEALINSNGEVFLIYSASGCWTDDYALGMLMLAYGTDPLVASNWTKVTTPVFTKKPGAFGPGHNAFFKSVSGNEDWIIYHANISSGQGCGDTRNPRMQKFTWNSNGTPNFGEPVAIGVPIQKPSGE